MTDSSIWQAISQKLASFSSSPSEPEAESDWQKNLKALFASTLTKFNLVSREEYEVQVALLKNARQQLNELEQVIKQLSDQLERSASQRPDA